jgi:hypothetical protein
LQLHKTAKLIFTGLGVGGAQAQLLLVYASLQLPDLKAKLKAVTYGSPQVSLSLPQEFSQKSESKEGTIDKMRRSSPLTQLHC